MSVTFVAVEVTPHRLLYLVTAVGVEIGPNTGIIPNRPFPGIGLYTDAASQFNASPLANLLNRPATTTALARTLVMGDGRTSAIDVNAARCKLEIIPRVSLQADECWSCDVFEGVAGGDALSANRAIIVIAGPNTNGATAYISLQYKHSKQL